MEFIALTTSGYSISEAESRNEVKRNFEKTRVSGEWIVWIQEKQLLTKNKIAMTTTEISTIPTIDPVIAQQKKESWGNLGVKIYNVDLELQARAQASIAKLFIPTNIDDVAKAEALLKEVKLDKTIIENDRKAVTNPVNNRMSELMNPEKSFDAPCKEVYDACVAIKKADQERQRLENEKLDAQRSCRQFLTTTRNNADASFKGAILEKVGKVYEHALGLGDVTMDMLPDYIDFALTRMNEKNFTVNFPLNTFKLVTEDQYKSMCSELLMFDAKLYLADYENQLRLKFCDYEVALNNKATALAISKKETETKVTEVKSTTINANVAAKIDAVAITPVVSIGTKALKQSYTVDMPETIESVIAIMTAFTAHINLCLPKLNVNKWFAFTPSQAGIALSKVKMDDDSFAPAGINFKQVDKL